MILVTVLSFAIACARVQGGELASFDWLSPGWVDQGPVTMGAQAYLPGPFGPLLVNVGPFGGMLVYETLPTQPANVHRIEWTDFDRGGLMADRCAFGAVPWFEMGSSHVVVPVIGR